ncbi:MAG: protein kinase [Bacteroidia bacterium]
MAVKKDHTADVLYPGKKIAGKYSLQARLGRSNLADVWLAEKDKKIWAVKLYLLPHALSEEQWESMQSVLENLPQFPSPLLQRPVEHGMIDGLPYVILPYCHYGSAHQWAGKLSESELATFMYQGAKALKMLHEANPPILHRNLHLFNFLIDQDLNYVLSDVALSGALRLICEEEESGYINIAYQAPETFQEAGYGPPADIFSFGMCMFQMATAQLAFGPQGGQRLLHWVQTPKLPDYFSDRFNQIIHVCIGRGASGRPSADILVRLAERYLAEGEWKSVPGFSFGVGRSAKRKSTLFDRRKSKSKQEPKPKRKPTPISQQRANPYTWGKKGFSISTKWLVAASIAIGIGITLYFINPLLELRSNESSPSEISNQGPIFAPTPSPEPIARPTIVDSGPTPESLAAKEKEIAEAILAESNKTVEVEVVKQPPVIPATTPAARSENPEPKASSAALPSEIKPSNAKPATPPKTAKPKVVRILSRDLRNLKMLISDANKLESQLSDLAFKVDSLNSNDQAYIKQLNSELNLLGRQIESRAVFDDAQNILGWRKEANNASWLKQMNASVRQHKGNLKRIQESI